MFDFRVIAYQYKVFVFLEAQLPQSATLANKFNQPLVYSTNLKLFRSVFAFCVQFKVISISLQFALNLKFLCFTFE